MLSDIIGIIAMEQKKNIRIPRCLDAYIIRKCINIFNTIIRRLTLIFRKCKFENIDIPEHGMQLYIAYFPFLEKKFNINSKRINKLCDEVVTEFTNQGIQYILLTKQIKDNKEISNIIYKKQNFYKFSGKELFASVLIDILRKIYKVVKIDIVHINIAVVENTISEKLKLIIKMLADNFKYITLITQDIETANEYSEKIYQDNGLTLRISQNFNSLKKTDCIIILSEFEKLINVSYIKNAPIVFNIGESFYIDKLIRAVVIDDINIEHEIINSVNLLKDIDSLELMECILSLKGKDVFKSNYLNFIQLNKEFYKYGCKVSILKGLGKTIKITKLDKVLKNKI